jgi:mannopine transport system permease protein
MILVFIGPAIQVFYQSFTDQGFTLKAYEKIASSNLLKRVVWVTIEISIISSLTTLLLGYAVAYHLYRQTPKKRTLLMIFVLLPFWTSILVKSYAFAITLGHNGIINTILVWLFGESARVKILYNRIGVIIGMSHYLLPFMVFPILASLLSQPKDLDKAAVIMGAGPFRIFWKITFPLSMPGVVSGVLITMILSLGMFITPDLLGGSKDLMLANMVDFYTRDNLNWNLASAIAVILLILASILILILFSFRGYGGLLGDER